MEIDLATYPARNRITKRIKPPAGSTAKERIEYAKAAIHELLQFRREMSRAAIINNMRHWNSHELGEAMRLCQLSGYIGARIDDKKQVILYIKD